MLLNTKKWSDEYEVCKFVYFRIIIEYLTICKENDVKFYGGNVHRTISITVLSVVMF